MTGFWDDADLIHTYTRAEAIDDGTLVDISAAAAEVGIRYPVAMTIGAWADCVAWEDTNDWPQDERGRLHDLVWMLSCAIRRAPADTDTVRYELLRVPNKPHAHRAVRAELRCVVGPGDNAEPVMTILLPSED